jgi:vacuolar-type H+-ATPase subunit C/Vma6
MKNMIMIARLKSEGVTSEEIRQSLVPYGNTVNQSTLVQLADTEDYEKFLNLLLETQLGKKVMRDLTGSPNPNELWEASLNLEYSNLSSNLEGNDARRVWRYILLLEHEERMIRKGLCSIKPLAGGSS